MSWSRFWRMFMLTGVWAAAMYAVSQSVISLFKKRRRASGKQSASAAALPSSLPAQEVVHRKAFLSPTLQRNGLIVVVALLLLGVVGQALIMLHMPIMNVFSAGKSSDGATFITQQPTATVTRTRSFETGIVTPQWQQQTAYGPQWQQSLSNIQTQTGAQWIELSLLFSQATSSSTVVRTTQSTPLVASFAAGVRAAHAKGLHVFVVPLMGVDEKGGWAGSIQFSSQAQEQAWFDSYWNTYKP